MPALSYTINGVFYPTQRELQQEVSALLRRYRAPYRLEHNEAALMMDLLERHPSAEQKIGCGVRAIWILSNGKFGNGYYVERTDGSWEDFSYKQCLRPFTHASKCKFAFRRAIDPQVNAVKKQVFPLPGAVISCPITGDAIVWETSHVDHEPPYTFAALLEQYMAWRGLTFDEIILDDPVDGIGSVLPPALSADWASWHAEHAVLRVISAEANIKLVR